MDHHAPYLDPQLITPRKPYHPALIKLIFWSCLTFYSRLSIICIRNSNYGRKACQIPLIPSISQQHGCIAAQSLELRVKKVMKLIVYFYLTISFLLIDHGCGLSKLGFVLISKRGTIINIWQISVSQSVAKLQYKL